MPAASSPASDLAAVVAADGLLQLTGVVAALVLAWRWVRDGTARNPLAGVAIAPRGPELAVLALVLSAYFFGAVGISRLLLPGPGADPPAPGSPAWNALHLSDDGLRLVLSLGMIAYLARRPCVSPAPAHRLGWMGAGCVALVIVLIAVPFCMLQMQMGTVILRWLWPDVPPPQHVVLEALSDRADPWRSVYLTVSAVVIAPLAEELFFRGLLLGALLQHLRHKWLAVLFSSLAFGMVHAGQPQAVLPLTTFGLMLGVARVRYDALGACVLAHALFNGRTMAIALLFPDLVRSL